MNNYFEARIPRVGFDRYTSLLEQNKQDKDNLLEEEVKRATSDGREYIVVRSEWHQDKSADFPIMRKTVGVYLKYFEQAEFENDVVVAINLKHTGLDVYQDVNGKIFLPVNNDRTLWRLENGKKDLRDASINPNTQFNPNLTCLTLEEPLTSSVEFFVSQVQRAYWFVENNMQGTLPNKLWLPRREYDWCQFTFMAYSNLRVCDYLKRCWDCSLEITYKQQLNNVVLLFIDNSRLLGYQQASTVVKYPQRTTWVFAENADELLNPQGAIALKW